MTRRGRGGLVIGVGAGVAVGIVGVAIWMTQAAEAADTDAAAAAPETATVQQRTLRVIEELSGTLGHGAERIVSAGVPGTLTALPAVGTLIERGRKLFDVDGAPVLLLYGEMPAWRALAAGVSGADVEQLEANLVELGYGDELTVDETWDAETTAAVTDWQGDVGHEADGRVDLGEVVFEPDAVVVAGLEGARGGGVGPGAPVLRVTGNERIISSMLSASQRDGVEVGDTVEVELAGGTRAAATIDEIDPMPTTAEDGSQGYGIRLTLDEPAGEPADGPVTLMLVRQERADVLAVPVNALLALLEGGYAVELVTDSGATALVAVDVGLFASGWVEVEGDLAAGDAVVVP